MKKRTVTIHALGSKLVLVLLLLGGVFAAPTGVAAETPNIVFIVADDLGYGELGCYGGIAGVVTRILTKIPPPPASKSALNCIFSEKL